MNKLNLTLAVAIGLMSNRDLDSIEIGDRVPKRKKNKYGLNTDEVEALKQMSPKQKKIFLRSRKNVGHN